MPYPSALLEIVQLCAGLSEAERREALWGYAQTAENFAPREDQCYVVKDERKDQQCLDKVGVYLAVNEAGKADYRIRLGPKVLTLTRALAAILCKGFRGEPVEAVLHVDRAFVPLIVGTELMRLRSQTVYYILDRMQEAARLATRADT